MGYELVINSNTSIPLFQVPIAAQTLLEAGGVNKNSMVDLVIGGDNPLCKGLFRNDVINFGGYPDPPSPLSSRHL